MTRTAVVVGANGRIGNAISRALAGHRLILVARRSDELETLGRSIEGARWRAMDAAEPGTLAAGLAELAPDGIDVAVNNLGVTHQPTPLADLGIDEFDRVVATTLRGVAVCMTAELAVMADGGAIVNVASDAGLRGVPGMAAYSAAKHGVIGLTRTAALDYAGRGIRVNAVAPGAVESGKIMTAPDEVRANVGASVPLGRMAGADEVASAVAWLVGAGYVTGTVVPIDGGRNA